MSFVGFVLFLFLLLIAGLTWKLLRDYQEYLKFYSFMETITGKSLIGSKINSIFVCYFNYYRVAQITTKSHLIIIYEIILEQEALESYFCCNGCFERIPEGANRYHCSGK